MRGGSILVWLVVLGSTLLSAVVLPAHAIELGPYAVILSRKPFGEPPPEPAVPSAEVPQPVGPSIGDQYKMCAVKETDDGIWVGFIEAKTSKSYYLKIGEEEDGIQVVDADYDLEKALLRKGAQEGWITMGKGGTGGAPGMPLGMLMSAPGVGAGTNRTSYAERRRQRLADMEARRKAMAEVPKIPPEEMQKKLEEYQMELIRQRGSNGPPLPLPLTPEMDDQLVAEGILPPNDGAERTAPAAE